MAVVLKVTIYEIPKANPQTFCAETQLDHLTENNIKGYGITPEDALDA